MPLNCRQRANDAMGALNGSERGSMGQQSAMPAACFGESSNSALGRLVANAGFVEVVGGKGEPCICARGHRRANSCSARHAGACAASRCLRARGRHLGIWKRETSRKAGAPHGAPALRRRRGVRPQRRRRGDEQALGVSLSSAEASSASPSSFEKATRGFAASPRCSPCVPASSTRRGRWNSPRRCAAEAGRRLLSSVRFSYDDEREVLHELGLDVLAAAIVALVGASGDGKMPTTSRKDDAVSERAPTPSTPIDPALDRRSAANERGAVRADGVAGRGAGLRRVGPARGRQAAQRRGRARCGWRRRALAGWNGFRRGFARFAGFADDWGLRWGRRFGTILFRVFTKRKRASVRALGLPEGDREPWLYLSAKWAVPAPTPAAAPTTRSPRLRARCARSAARRSFRIACARTAASTRTARSSKPNRSVLVCASAPFGAHGKPPRTSRARATRREAFC